MKHVLHLQLPASQCKFVNSLPKNMPSIVSSYLSGMSSVANFLKSYQMRTGKPREMSDDEAAAAAAPGGARERR